MFTKKRKRTSVQSVMKSLHESSPSPHILEMSTKKIKNYKCDVCQGTFAQKVTLSNNVKEMHLNKSRGKLNCYQKFFENVKYGPMFGCISCHIANYIRSVDVFDGQLRNKLEEKYSDPEIFDDLINEAYYNVSIRGVQEKVYLDVDKDGTGEKEFYICRTCKNAFQSNKLPSRCIFN